MKKWLLALFSVFCKKPKSLPADPEREMRIILINAGDFIYQDNRIPFDVPSLYRQACSYGYKGIQDYDAIVSFLKDESIDWTFHSDIDEWSLSPPNKPAPQEVLEYAVERGYKGDGDCRSVGLYLHSIGMTPLRHHDGHWSLESAPDFCYR